eukprot:GEZU01000809.1.p1 GENE.GEZU01000809.1~~GEZU01000809.1.p1  ORF type:complete len:489 (-),score=102.83 GEZU01000809.1:146-1612(-)
MRIASTSAITCSTRALRKATTAITTKIQNSAANYAPLWPNNQYLNNFYSTTSSTEQFTRNSDLDNNASAQQKQQKLKHRVLIIAGATGVGKSEFGISLAKLLDGEIISADSVQVYKGLTVGSNVIAEAERMGIPHHMLGVTELPNHCTAGTFHDMARPITEEIIARDRTPIVVGGAGFYLKSYIYGKPAAPPSPHERLEAITQQIKNEDGGNWEKSLKRLRDVDPEYAAALKENDYYRLIRAIEVVTRTGQPMKEFAVDTSKEPSYDFRCIHLYRDRMQQYRMLDDRCEKIVENGLFEEVYGLLLRGDLIKNSTAAQSVGYHQAISFFKHTRYPATANDFFAFLAEFKAASRQYAKKQYHWFRKEKDFRWVNADDLRRGVQEIVSLFHMPRAQYLEIVASKENQAVQEETIVNKKEAKKLFRQYKENEGIYHKYPFKLKERLDKINKLLRDAETRDIQFSYSPEDPAAITRLNLQRNQQKHAAQQDAR